MGPGEIPPLHPDARSAFRRIWKMLLFCAGMGSIGGLFASHIDSVALLAGLAVDNPFRIWVEQNKLLPSELKGWLIIITLVTMLASTGAIALFPYPHTGSISRRSSTSGLVYAFLITALFSWLEYRFLVSPGMGLDDMAAGHAKAAFVVAVNSGVGLAIFGVMIWSLAMISWLSAAMCFFLLFARLVGNVLSMGTGK